MKREILIIVPSRSENSFRYANVDRFISCWQNNTEGLSDLCIALDDDDYQKYHVREGVIYEINPRARLIPLLNQIALKYKDDYKYIAFFGDDNVILTPWESTFIEYFKQNGGIGIAYGNDLYQRENLPTTVCMTTNIINKLGYMIYPSLTHMYADNFWKDLGEACGIIKYFDHIVFEHLHPVIGKSVQDTIYNQANAVFYEDKEKYFNYKDSTEFISNCNKIKDLTKILRGRIEIDG